MRNTKFGWLFLFGLVLLAGLPAVAAAQQFTQAQCAGLNGGMVTSDPDCTGAAAVYPGLFKVGDYISGGTCQVLGSCCALNSPTTTPAACTPTTCPGTCRIACSTNEGPTSGGTCPSGQTCCEYRAPTTGGSTTPIATFNYTLLEEIPGTAGTSGDFGSYLQSLYRFTFFGIGIAALFMLTVGGFMYVTSAGNTSRVETAKTIITDSFLGILIALFAWLFLYVINPDLVQRMPVAAPLSGGAVGGGGGTGGTGGTGGATGSPWQSDASERASLAPGVTVNVANCATIGQASCTSLAGSAAISAVNALASACGCSFVISGGTEYWLHGSGGHHRPGDYAIDLKHGAVDNYIRSNGTEICRISGRPAYRIGNAVYWDEDDAHWHVNFNKTTCREL